MKNQLKMKFQMFMLLAMCFVLLGQNLTTLTDSKFDSGTISLESTGESESEPNEKISDTEIECDEYDSHSFAWSLYSIEFTFQFPNYTSYVVSTFPDGMDFPPEC